MKLPADLSTETLQARKEWQEKLKEMKIKGLQPRLLYPARLSVRTQGKISFADKRRLKEYPYTKPAL